MKDDHSPPLQWKLGVIEVVHYGGDELGRVDDVRTQSGVFAEQYINFVHCLLMQSNLFVWDLDILSFVHFLLLFKV
jgi:hypothetical protein